MFNKLYTIKYVYKNKICKDLFNQNQKAKMEANKIVELNNNPFDPAVAAVAPPLLAAAGSALAV